MHKYLENFLSQDFIFFTVCAISLCTALSQALNACSLPGAWSKFGGTRVYRNLNGDTLIQTVPLNFDPSPRNLGHIPLEEPDNLNSACLCIRSREAPWNSPLHNPQQPKG